jgi:hypothetical protein
MENQQSRKTACVGSAPPNMLIDHGETFDGAEPTDLQLRSANCSLLPGTAMRS